MSKIENAVEATQDQTGVPSGSTRAWKHLVSRPESWRRQLYLKVRNITVGQLVSTLIANQETPEQASTNLDLPIEAILEAIAYYEQNKKLIESEAATERQFLRDRGYRLEPPPLS